MEADAGRGRVRDHRRSRPAEKMAPSYMARVLRLTLLAPDIVEPTLDARSGPGLTLAQLLKPFPADWDEQREMFR